MFTFSIFKRMAALFSVPLALLFSVLGLQSGVSNSYRSYKNVILMVGDGMGPNHLEAAKQALGIEELAMETMPVRGESKTFFLLPFIPTDSAAGGTALACGVTTIPGIISLNMYDPLGWFSVPKSISERALESGKSAGVVTTDSTSGATPAAFSAHCVSRDDEAAISKGQLASGLQLIWGAGSTSITQSAAEAKGFTLVTDRAGWNALQPGQRSFAQFNGGDLSETKNTERTPTLEEMTVRAIDILSANTNGFFLMVEGAHIDKYSHSNDMENTVRCVAEFDLAVAAALDWANARNNTLVIVTADHETGGLQYDATKDEYNYTSTGHSTQNVPFFVSQTDAGFADGQAVKNRQIGAQMAMIMGFQFDNRFFYDSPERKEAA